MRYPLSHGVSRSCRLSFCPPTVDRESILGALDSGASGLYPQDLQARGDDRGAQGWSRRAASTCRRKRSRNLAVKSPARTPRGESMELTERQRDVLRLILKGYNNERIASRAGDRAEHGEAARARDLHGLGVSTRAEAVIAAAHMRLRPASVPSSTAVLEPTGDFPPRALAVAWRRGGEAWTCGHQACRPRCGADRGFVWALAACAGCTALPSIAALVLKQFPPPYDLPTLLRAAQACGLKAGLAGRAGRRARAACRCPASASFAPSSRRTIPRRRSRRCWCAPTASACSIFSPARKRRAPCRCGEFAERFEDTVLLAAPASPRRTIRTAAQKRAFGFRWFVPELARHRAHLARRAARLARDPARRPRHAALHAGGDRQGGGAPDAEHADRHRRGAGHLPASSTRR